MVLTAPTFATTASKDSYHHFLASQRTSRARETCSPAHSCTASVMVFLPINQREPQVICRKKSSFKLALVCTTVRGTTGTNACRTLNNKCRSRKYECSEQPAFRAVAAAENHVAARDACGPERSHVQTR